MYNNCNTSKIQCSMLDVHKALDPLDVTKAAATVQINRDDQTQAQVELISSE